MALILTPCPAATHILHISYKPHSHVIPRRNNSPTIHTAVLGGLEIRDKSQSRGYRRRIQSAAQRNYDNS
eukprot:1356413-Amorphochlora_amoeboformis.AAC.2